MLYRFVLVLAFLLVGPAAAFDAAVSFKIAVVKDRAGLFECVSDKSEVEDLYLPTCEMRDDNRGGGTAQCVLMVKKISSTDLYRITGTMTPTTRRFRFSPKLWTPTIDLDSPFKTPNGDVHCTLQGGTGLEVGNIKAKGGSYEADVVRTDARDGKPRYFHVSATVKKLQ